MKNIILSVCLIALISGCATTPTYKAPSGPNIFQQREMELEQAYKDGKITYSEYLTHYNEIENQRIQALSAAMGFMAQQQNAVMSVYNSRQYQPPKTTTTRGSITPMGGGYYNYKEKSTTY